MPNCWCSSECAASYNVIRFKLRTLLALAMIVGIAALAWTLMPELAWPDILVRIRDGNLVILFGAVKEPSWNIPLPVQYRYRISVPFWLVVMLVITGFIALASTLRRKPNPENNS